MRQPTVQVRLCVFVCVRVHVAPTCLSAVLGQDRVKSVRQVAGNGARLGSSVPIYRTKVTEPDQLGCPGLGIVRLPVVLGKLGFPTCCATYSCA